MSVSPQDFDFDAWLDGAERPERGVTVYQKAGLLAELDWLESQITNAELDEGEITERGIGEIGESQKLRAKYAELAQQFHDSALHLRVRAMDDHEQVALRKANPGLTPSDFGYLVISEAITSHKITPEQLRKMNERLGELQFSRIFEAFNQANTEAPAVSADFLPKPSTPDDGGE